MISNKIEKQIIKASNNHLKNLERLCKKPFPSEKELEEMYSYLDYCFLCGKRLRFMEAYTHGFGGNIHKFGCNFFERSLGYIYQVFKAIFLLILVVPWGIYEGFKWIYNNLIGKK